MWNLIQFRRCIAYSYRSTRRNRNMTCPMVRKLSHSCCCCCCCCCCCYCCCWWWCCCCCGCCCWCCCCCWWWWWCNSHKMLSLGTEWTVWKGVWCIRRRALDCALNKKVMSSRSPQSAKGSLFPWCCKSPSSHSSQPNESIDIITAKWLRLLSVFAHVAFCRLYLPNHQPGGASGGSVLDITQGGGGGGRG